MDARRLGKSVTAAIAGLTLLTAGMILSHRQPPSRTAEAPIRFGTPAALLADRDATILVQLASAAPGRGLGR